MLGCGACESSGGLSPRVLGSRRRNDDAGMTAPASAPDAGAHAGPGSNLQPPSADPAAGKAVCGLDRLQIRWSASNIY